MSDSVSVLLPHSKNPTQKKNPNPIQTESLSMWSLYVLPHVCVGFHLETYI